MERYSVREVVEQAVRTEKLGFEFYTSMMQRFAENKPLQEFFGSLAEQEKEHERVFLAHHDLGGHGLAVVFRQHGFGVEQIELARRPAHEEVDHAFRARREMRSTRRQRIWCASACRIPESIEIEP